MKAIIALIVVLNLYSHLVRYWELRRYTTMTNFKQYLFNMQGLTHAFNLTALIIITYLLSKL